MVSSPWMGYLAAVGYCFGLLRSHAAESEIDVQTSGLMPAVYSTRRRPGLTLARLTSVNLGSHSAN